MCRYELTVRCCNGDEITDTLDCDTVVHSPSKALLLVNDMLMEAMARDHLARLQSKEPNLPP